MPHLLSLLIKRLEEHRLKLASILRDTRTTAGLASFFTMHKNGASIIMDAGDELPPVMYHGTTFPIHTSTDPYLDPSRAKGQDEGDPSAPHVFATPDKLWASVFSLKADNCIANHLGKRPIIIYHGFLPDISGWVYELPSKGFKQLMIRGWPTSKWVMVDEDMPSVLSSRGYKVKGIPLTHVPVTHVTGFEQLIAEYGLRVYVLHECIDKELFLEKKIAARREGKLASFLQEQVEMGVLKHMNPDLLAKQPHVQIPQEEKDTHPGTTPVERVVRALREAGISATSEPGGGIQAGNYTIGRKTGAIEKS